MITRKVLFTALLLGGFLSFSTSLHATAIANSNLSFGNLQITPEAGGLGILYPWEQQAYAEAQNSFGDHYQAYISNVLGAYSVEEGSGNASCNGQPCDSINPPYGNDLSAHADVPMAAGNGNNQAPDFFPPDLSITGQANSGVNVPGCDPKWAYAAGTSTFFNTFVVSSDTPGSVNVDFSADITGSKYVYTDPCGILARTDLTFSLQILDVLPPDTNGNPQDSLVLSHYDWLICGPGSCEKSESVAETLKATRLLEFNHEYAFVVEVDSESKGIVPEPSTLGLLPAGLAAMAFARNRKKPTFTAAKTDGRRS